jgi:hypothetical protein
LDDEWVIFRRHGIQNVMKWMISPTEVWPQNHVVIAQQRDRIQIFTSTTMTEEDASKDIYQ